MHAPWMKIALAELGVKELKGAKKNNPRILEYLETEGSRIKVLGGNQGDAVSVRTYPKSRLPGYRWPVPVGQVVTRDARGRIISTSPIEGMVITGSRH